MKRIIITSAIWAATAAAVNAQFFVEGSARVSYSDWGKTSHYNSTIILSPLAGYRLNEKFAVGIKTSLFWGGYGGFSIDANTGEEIPYERKHPGWSLAVFDRYKIWGSKKISFWVESSVFIREYNWLETRGSTTIRNQTDTQFGIQAFPLITYDLSDRFSLVLTTAFLNLDLYASTIKYNDTGLKSKSYHCDFNVQTVFTGDLIGIGVGVIYHFNKKSSK